MTILLDELHSRAEELSNTTADLLKQSKDLPAEASDWLVSGTTTFAELLTKTGSVASLAAELAKTPEDRFLIAPTTRLISLRDQLTAAQNAAANLTANLAKMEQWGGVSRFEPNGQLYATNGTAINLGSLASALQSALDGTLEQYLLVAAAVQPRGIGTFAAASRVLSEKATEAAATVEQLTQSLNEWRAQIEQAKAQGTTIAKTETESRRNLEEIEKARRTIEENTAKATAAAASIEEVRTQAAALEAAVTGYQETFQAFQKQLDQREETLRKGNRSVGELEKALHEKDKQIGELIAKAEEMLGGATTAGLASAYKDQAEAVDLQLRDARTWYDGSIALLIVSVLAALNVFSALRLQIGLPALPSITPDMSAGTIAVQALSALGTRALLILPALLLAGFAARRHAALFRLREEYAHKYTTAASVQGFQKQAPTYNEPIAAAVFAELLKNPAASMDAKKSGRSRNSFLDRLIMPRVDEALKRAGELPGSE